MHGEQLQCQKQHLTSTNYTDSFVPCQPFYKISANFSDAYLTVKLKFLVVRMLQTSLGKADPEYTDYKYWKANVLQLVPDSRASHSKTIFFPNLSVIMENARERRCKT